MQLNRILQSTIRNSLRSKFKRERKDVKDNAMVAEMKKKFGAPGRGGRPKKRLVTDDSSLEDENGQPLPAAKTTRREVSVNH